MAPKAYPHEKVASLYKNCVFKAISTSASSIVETLHLV